MRLIERGDYRSLVEFELNYSDPNLTAHAVKQCRQALAFFQKLPDLRIGIDKEAVALRKFLEAEELCRQTNSILSMHRRGLLSWPSRVESVFHAAQRKIARILGPVPSISQLDLRFGPGATRGVKRTEASIRRKIAERPQCSEDFLPIAAMVLGEMPHLTSVHESPDSLRIEMTTVGDDVSSDDEWEQYLEDENPSGPAFMRHDRVPPVKAGIVVDEWVSVPVEIVPARLNFVPKNAKTHRSVCVEAGLNVTYQLALGSFMAKRLAAFGIDIRDQSLNQRRALEGSLTGALATLDLSSASDTVSRELVFELLPLEWADLLKWGRSSTVELPSGETMTQEKFASMGNGYTFPLETLIFWGLAAACCDCDSDATVYGDDIVLPSEKFELLSEVLRYAGFLVNAGKSFHTGPFRESCGKDYFRGIDVRPFYAKGWVSAQLLFVLHNFYVRDRDDQRAKVVEDLIHPDLKLWGPDGYGDGHLIGEHPKSRPDKYHSRGFGGYFFNTFTTKQRRDITPIAAGDFVLPLYTVYRRSGDDFVEITDDLKRIKDDLFLPQKWKEHAKSILVRGALKSVVQCAPLPLPEKEGTKALTLPGVEGYKRITIYTLGS
jgi:hypothetical protein